MTDALRDWNAANARARYAYRHSPLAASQQMASGAILRLLQTGRIDAPTAYAMRREVERWSRQSYHAADEDAA